MCSKQHYQQLTKKAGTMIINPTSVSLNQHGEVNGVTFVTSKGTVAIVARKRPSYNASIYDKNDYLARPRAFASSTEVTSALSPTAANKALRNGSVSLLAELGLPIGNFELKFSKNAGCRDCACSPGFILQVEGYNKHRNTINLRFTLPDGKEVNFARYDLYIDLGQQESSLAA
jgi:hypothetical protein